MKTVPTALAAHLQGEVTTLATVWKLTLRDGTVMGFTDHSADLVVDGVTCVAATGFARSAISAQSDLSVANMEVDGVLDSSAITAGDLRAGRFDFAAVEVSIVCWADLTMGKVVLRSGWIGEVTAAGGMSFQAEVRGLAQRLQTKFVEQYSPDCRAQFGDARCGFDVSTVTETGTVSGVSGNALIAASVSGGRAAGFFNGGTLTFTGGLNTGLSYEVKQHDAGAYFHFFLPVSYAVTVGDTFSVAAGCAKTVAACVAYSNIKNFRGEPYVPGNDQMLRVGGQAGGAIVP